MSKPRWVIRCFSYGVTFWSNEWGWGDYEGADRFSDEEQATLNLPIDGVWMTEDEVVRSGCLALEVE